MQRERRNTATHTLPTALMSARLKTGVQTDVRRALAGEVRAADVESTVRIFPLSQLSISLSISLNLSEGPAC